MATVLDKIKENIGIKSGYYVFLGLRDIGSMGNKKSIKEQLAQLAASGDDSVGRKVATGDLPLEEEKIFRRSSLLNTDNGKTYTKGRYLAWDHNVWEANRPAVAMFKLIDDDTLREDLINFNKKKNVVTSYISPELDWIVDDMFKAGDLKNNHMQDYNAIREIETAAYDKYEEDTRGFNRNDILSAESYDYQKDIEGNRQYFMLTGTINDNDSQKSFYQIKSSAEPEKIMELAEPIEGVSLKNAPYLAVADPMGNIKSGGIEYKDKNFIIVRDDATNSLNLWTCLSDREMKRRMYDMIQDAYEDSNDYPSISETNAGFWKNASVAVRHIHNVENNKRIEENREKLNRIAKSLGEGFHWEASGNEKWIRPNEYWLTDFAGKVTAPIGIHIPDDQREEIPAAIIRMQVTDGKLHLDVSDRKSVIRDYDASDRLTYNDITALQNIAYGRMSERFSLDNKDKYFIPLGHFEGDLSKAEEVKPKDVQLVSATHGHLPYASVPEEITDRYAVTASNELYEIMDKEQLQKAIADRPYLLEDCKFMKVSNDVQPIIDELDKQGRYAQLLGSMFPDDEETQSVSKEKVAAIDTGGEKAKQGLHGVLRMSGDGYVSPENTLSRMVEDDGARWHQTPQKIQEARLYDGNLLALWNEHHIPMPSKYQTRMSPDHGTNLKLSIFAHIEGLTPPVFLTEQNVKDAGLKVNPILQPIPVVETTKDGSSVVRELYTLKHTDDPDFKLFQRETEGMNTPEGTEGIAADTQEETEDRRMALKELAEDSRWRVPVTVKDEIETETGNTFAYYDKKDDTVYVKGESGNVTITGEDEIRELTSALADSLLDSGRVRGGEEFKKDVKSLVGQMTTIEYALEDNSPEGPVISKESADRLRDDPQFVSELLGTASKISTAISQRSYGLDDDLDEVIDDDRHLDDDQSNNIDLRATNPNGLDGDDNGIADEQETLEASRKNENGPETHPEIHAGHSHGRGV